MIDATKLPAGPIEQADGACPARIWHGPGHQSGTHCRKPAGHDGPHEAIYGGNRFAEWMDGSYRRRLEARGLPVPGWVDEGTAMTGSFDEPPEGD